MKKTNLKIPSLMSFVLLGGIACTNCSVQQNTIINIDDCTIKNVNVYRSKDKVDKQIPIHFFNNMPHVPYIGVNEYFNEFFKVNLKLEKNNNIYTYYNTDNEYLRFACDLNIFCTSSIDNFEHPDALPNRSRFFLENVSHTHTQTHEKVVSLNDYFFGIYGDGNEVYVPLTFLSDMFGGSSGYNVTYNGQDIFVIDCEGLILRESDGQPHDPTYYGEKFYEVLADLETPRYEDLAKYTYNQLCFTFDHLRGFTTQLAFIDNNLLSMGLNGLIEEYFPEIKEYLLSTNKSEYLMGETALFFGLWDGGHTGLLTLTNEENAKSSNQLKIVKECLKVVRTFDYPQLLIPCIPALRHMDFYSKLNDGVESARNKFLPTREIVNEELGFYYYADKTYKTAFIGFDGFELSYGHWNDFYSGTIDEKTLSTFDTYAFIRNKLIQAKTDGMEKVILDLSSNGGGSSGSLLGIVGLLNEGSSQFSYNNTLNRYRETFSYNIDINLDGKVDEEDKNFAIDIVSDLKIGVLTSRLAFSCGNLLPCVLKELGYKIIGQHSGGGSCSIMYSTTADGLFFVHSSPFCLSDNAGNNIDYGVAPDLSILPTLDEKIDEQTGEPVQTFICDDFFDIQKISNWLDTAYNEN